MISPDKKYEVDPNLYNPSEIEKKWQSIWTENNLYKTDELAEKSDKFYALSMFPYPSGNLHMGHVRNYVCLLYTSPSPRDRSLSRMPSSA